MQGEICSIQPQMLSTVMENAVQLASVCEAENGGHFLDIIFHK